MKSRSKIGLAALGAAALLVILPLFLHSPPARRYALERARGYLHDRGIELQAGSLEYNLLGLSATLKNVVMRAAGVRGETPFLRLDSGYVNLRLWPLLRGQLSVEEATMDGLTLHIVLDEEGWENLPRAAAHESPPEPSPDSLPEFLISSLEVSRGSLLCEDRSRKVRLSLPGWRLGLAGDPARGEHRIRIRTEKLGEVIVEQRQVPLEMLELEADLRPSSLEIDRLQLVAPGLSVRVSGMLEGFSRRELDLRVSTDLDLGTVARFADLERKIAGSLRGEIGLTGPANGLRASGELEVRQAAAAGFRDVEITARIEWDQVSQRLQVPSLNVRSRDGTVHALGEMNLGTGKGRSRLEARVENLDLHSISRSLNLPYRLAGRAGGAFTAEWPGTAFEQVEGSARFRIAATRSVPSPQLLPLSGSLSLTARDKRIVLDIAELEALGSRWRGRLQLRDFQHLGGELEVQAAALEQLAASLEVLLDGKGEFEALRGGEVQLNATLGGTLDDPTVAVAMDGAGIAAGRMRGIRLKASGNYRSTGILVEEGLFSWQDQTISLRGNVDRGREGAALELDVRADRVSVGAMLAGMGVEIPLEGELNLQAGIRGALDSPEVTIEGSVTGLKVYGEVLGSLALKGQMAARKLAVTELRLEQPLLGGQVGWLEAEGTYDLESGVFDLQSRGEGLKLATLELPGAVPVRGELGLSVQGSGTLEKPSLSIDVGLSGLEVDGSPLGDLSVLARLEGNEAFLETLIPQLDLAAKANLQTVSPYPIEFEIAARGTDLSRLAIPVAGGEPLSGSLTATIKGAGDLEHWDQGRGSARISDLRLNVLKHQIRNEGDLPLAFEDGVLKVQPSTLVTGDSRLRLEGSLPLDESNPPGSLSVLATFDLASLTGLLPAKPAWAATGTAGVEAVLRGSLRRLEPEARITLKNGFFDWPDFHAGFTGIDLDASFRQGSLRLERVAANFGPAALEASAEIPTEALGRGLPFGIERKGGAATFTLDVKDLELSDFKEVPAGMTGRIGLRIEGETSRLDDPQALRAQAVFSRMSVKMAEYELRQESPASITLADGLARVDRFVLSGPKTRIELAGTAEITGKRPLDLRLSGNMDAGLLSLLAQDFQAAGEARLQIAVQGTADEPDLSGFFEVKRAQASLRSPRLLAENLNLLLNLAPGRIEVRELTGRLNGGALHGAGSLGYTGAGLADLKLHVSTEGAYLNFPEGLRTQVNSDLTLSSQGEQVWVGGTIRIPQGSYREPLELEGELLSYLRSERSVLAEERSPFLSRVRYNITLDTEEPLWVNNNLAKLALDATLRVVGTYYQPALTGRIAIEQGGEIYLNERKYFVERGVISFDNQTRINPNLDILAKTRVGRWDIDLEMRGSPEKFAVTFTSDPSLTEPEIVSVLLTGRTPEEVRGAELNVAREQALSYLSGRVAGRLSRRAEETLGLSQVRIEPNLISPESNPGARLTIGQEITKILRLIYSVNLTDSGDQIYIVEYDVVRGLSSRAIRQDDNSYRFELRHDLRFGDSADAGRQSRAPVLPNRLGGIRFRGDLVFTEKMLASKLGIDPGDHYDFFRVQQGVDRLQRYYEEQGRLEARIRVDREAGDRTVDLEVEIDAGPEVDLAFIGSAVPGKVQSQIRQIWSQGIFDEQRVEESVRALRGHLVREGHFQSKVVPEIAEPAAGMKRVTFHIDPGLRYRDVALVLDGASRIEPSELVGVLRKEKLDSAVHAEPEKVLDFLALYYRQKGFLDAKIGKPRSELDAQGGSGRVVLPIEEGPLSAIGTVKFQGNRAFDAERLTEIAALPSGAPYRPELLQAAQARLEELYWSKGYNDALVGHEPVHGPAGGIDVTFRITENRQGVVEKISVEGNRRTSDEFVRSQLSISAGDVLEFEKTSHTRHSLYGTGAYSLVDVETQPSEDGEGVSQSTRKPVELRVRLREIRPFELRYGAFYDTDRGPGVIADFANRNSLGQARVLGVRARYDSDIRELRGYFSQPLVRKLPLRTNVTGFARRETLETFFTDRSGFSFQQEAQFRNSLILSYGYRFERTKTTDKDPESLFQIPPFNLAPLTLAFTRETRDDFLDATRGSFTSHALEYAPDLLGSDLRFVRYFGQYFKYIPLSQPAEIPYSGGQKKSRFVYAGDVRIGLAKGLGGQDLIRSERFFAGGGTTLRGFDQDSIGPRDFLGDPAGGDALFIMNHELRYPLFNIFDGATFLDVGNVYQRISDFNPFKVRKSAGLGLRVRTPYFLLRLDYGLNLDRQPGESRGGFFFSIGQAF